jgi:predicted nucleic acid-binding protein
MAGTNRPSGLTDADILIDASRGVPQAVQFLLDQRTASGICISVISQMELIAGCRDKTELAQVDQLATSVRVLPLTDAVSITACELMKTFRLSHGLLLPDSLIAATAINAGLQLYTRNMRHFQMIPNLSVVRPY